MELYRRAVAMRDERAWSLIYDLYRGLVMSWINTYTYVKGMIRCDLEEQDALVNTAFARFFCAFTAEHLAQCPSIASILFYLKLCTRSTVFDALRRQQVRLVELSLDALQETHYDRFSPEQSDQDQVIVEQVIGQIWAEDLWQVIQEELHRDDERILLCLLYVQEMQPAQIARQYPQWFPTLDTVLLLRGRIRTRLLKNPRIRAILAAHRGNDAAPTPAILSPFLDLVPLGAHTPAQANHLRLTPSVLQAARPTQDPLADAAEEQRSVQLVANEPVVVAAAASMHATPPPQPGPVPIIHYRLQKVFCGKARCQKCRDGHGHGPYWYAYQTINGQTKTTYLGKALPNENERERAPTDGKEAAPCAVPQKPVPEISYHLQRTFCGKDRCRKCRDGGEGHGPYWFAYELVNGKTVRRYVGKALPAGVTAEGSVARTWANSAEGT
jgi:DNA-directed RNA polymerase specialized sigma24 family protein